MNQAILNQMRLQIDMALGTLAKPRPGIVSSYDPTHYAVKVELQPEGVETGWLALASPWIGNGWGLFAPPTVGDQVDVHFYDGNFEAGYVSQRFFNDVDVPLNVPSGEFWLVHKSGNYLKFKNDGTVQGHGPLTWDGDATITGNLTVEKNIVGQQNVTAAQDISDQNGAHGTIGQLRSAYDGHTHTDPQGGTTGAPSSTM